MKIKTILFDMDNTLIDMAMFHYEALNIALEAYGKDIIPINVHKEHFDGLPTKVKLTTLGVRSDLIPLIEKEKQMTTLKLIDERINYDVDKVRLIKYIKEKGLQVGVVTNSITQTAKNALINAGLFKLLDILITNEDIKFSKPNSEGYITAMVKLNSLPSETIIVEDSKYGIIAAENTGAKVIKVNNPSELTIELLKGSIK